MSVQKLRRGYTTGTCAQAATKAAMEILLGIRRAHEAGEVWVQLPKGEKLKLKISDIKIDCKETEKFPAAVSCGVEKDSGDDPDITNGVFIYSKVMRAADRLDARQREKLCLDKGSGERIRLKGGPGVGRVTKPGLDQPVGAAAINRVPRRMIIKEAEDICEETGYEGGIDIEISIPGGEELAKKTFNPRLGVEGGLSILGTSGIVEPMSEQAILDTIYLDMKVKLAGQKAGARSLIMAPGNYGLGFLQEEYGIGEDAVVKCSNYIGQSIDMAKDLQCDELFLAGHIGKLVKVAGGIMNTHSKWADGRMEILAASALLAGFSAEKSKELLACVTVDDALSRCTKEERVRLMLKVMEKMEHHLRLRGGEEMAVEAVTFSKMYGILGKTDRADEMAAKFL